MRNTHWFAFLVIVSFSVFFTSCVRFDGQSMTYRYDSEKDELRIFQIYERISAEGNDGKITNVEKTQLGDVVLGQHTFFFATWITDYDHKRVKESIAAAKKKGDDARVIELMELLVSSVRITNGQFYLNENKELCAYQEVTISNVSQLVARGNQVGGWLLELEELMTEFSGEQQKQIRTFYETSKFIEVDGNGIVVRFPMSHEQQLEMRKNMADAPLLAKLFVLGISMNYQEPIMEFSIGRKDTKQTQIEIDKLADGKYNTLLLDHVRQNYTIKEEFDVEKARNEFLNN